MSKKNTPDWSMTSEVVVDPRIPTRYALESHKTKGDEVFRILDIKEKRQVTILAGCHIKQARKIVQAMNKAEPHKAVTAIILPEDRIVRQGKPYGIGLATFNEPGYTPWKGIHDDAFSTYAEAQKEADYINTEILHLSKRDAYFIVLSSLRGGVHHEPAQDEEE